MPINGQVPAQKPGMRWRRLFRISDQDNPHREDGMLAVIHAPQDAIQATEHTEPIDRADWNEFGRPFARSLDRFPAACPFLQSMTKLGLFELCLAFTTCYIKEAAN